MIQKQTITASGVGAVVNQSYQMNPQPRSVFVKPEDPKVLIVVTAVNLWKEYTKPCLDSLFKQNLPPHISMKVLLADNGSIDETKEDAKRLMGERKDFYAFLYKENIGVQKIWNKCIEHGFGANYDYVFIINNDVLFHQNAIKRLVERFEKKDEKVVMMTSLDMRGECMMPDDIFNKDDRDKDDVPESPSPNFSAFMINKKLIKEVGWFDIGFHPAYFEDNDMHYRIKLAGLEAICCPQSLFYHFASKTQGDPRYPGGFTSNEEFARCRNYFIQKWGGMPGKETFTHPFNDSNKSIKWVKQDLKQ